MSTGGSQPHPAAAAAHGATARVGANDRVVRVAAASRKYDVIVGEAVRFELTDAVRASAPDAKRAVLFIDAGLTRASVVDAVHMSLTRAGLAVVHGPASTIVPSETGKSLATVEALLVAMASAKLDRGDVAVALGGGVLGDLVGFAAATYRRGIAWINLPTTLLAMVDASVGGKTGANLLVEGRLKKNMVGAFWQPSLVAADVDVLRTLDERHFRAGLAECIKHGMLAADWGDEPLGAWTSASLPAILRREPGSLVELVARNVTVKARVVGTDEREEAPDADGGRALLNLGHTFGHAIETLPNLSPDGDPAKAPLHHGEAVALGLVAASAAAEAVGVAKRGLAEETREVLREAGLPVAVKGLPTTDELIGLMMHDKKVAGGVLRLVLPRGDGRCVVVSGPGREAVVAGWEGVRG